VATCGCPSPKKGLNKKRKRPAAKKKQTNGKKESWNLTQAN